MFEPVHLHPIWEILISVSPLAFFLFGLTLYVMGEKSFYRRLKEEQMNDGE